MGNETREILLTQDGFNKLEQELEYLRGAKRIEVAGRIKIAIEFGDISENSEYDEAKNEQAQLEMRILDLENTLRLAKVVDEGEISTRKVGIGIVVKLYDYEFEEEVSYTIVGATEVDITENKISTESPVGKAIMGKKKNDEVEVETPNGVCKYKILDIKRA